MTSQVSSAYLLNGDSVLGFQFQLRSLKLYVTLSVASFLNGKDS